MLPPVYGPVRFGLSGTMSAWEFGDCQSTRPPLSGVADVTMGKSRTTRVDETHPRPQLQFSCFSHLPTLRDVLHPRNRFIGQSTGGGSRDSCRRVLCLRQSTCWWPLPSLVFRPPCRLQIHRRSYVDRGQVNWTTLSLHGYSGILHLSFTLPLLTPSLPVKTTGQRSYEICL